MRLPLAIGLAVAIVSSCQPVEPPVGTTRQCTNVVDDPAMKVDHSVTLTGLSPGTRYYYAVGTPRSREASWTLAPTAIR